MIAAVMASLEKTRFGRKLMVEIGISFAQISEACAVRACRE
jgi:hypothetical protein